MTQDIYYYLYKIHSFYLGCIVKISIFIKKKLYNNIRIINSLLFHVKLFF